MIKNDIKDQVLFEPFSLFTVVEEAKQLTAELQAAGVAPPVIVALAKDAHNLMRVILGISQGSLTAIIFGVWIILKILVSALWIWGVRKAAIVQSAATPQTDVQTAAVAEPPTSVVKTDAVAGVMSPDEIGDDESFTPVKVSQRDFDTEESDLDPEDEPEDATEVDAFTRPITTSIIKPAF